MVSPSEEFEEELWEWIINTDVGNPWPEPSWFDQPALGRTAINTPHDLQLLRQLNKDKPYIEQIRPGTFLTLAHAHPIEEPGLLIAPYTSDPETALASQDWIHRGSGETGLTIRTDRPEYVIEGSVMVLDYRHYAAQYRTHNEWKAMADLSATLQRRLVVCVDLQRIGKEAGVIDVDQPQDSPATAMFESGFAVCQACQSPLTGRQRLWCSEVCRARG